MKTKESIRDLENTIKWTNTFIGGVIEGESEKQTVNLFKEIKAETFPSWEKETDIQTQEAQKTTKKDESKQLHRPRHIIIKLPKVTKRILKAARVKQLYVKSNVSHTRELK